MGTDDGSVVKVEWVGENVKVTGKTEGVAAAYFGLNQACTKDRFEVIVICY